MIRHSPCEYYLKYLVTHPKGYTDEEVQSLVKDKGLDWLGKVYLEKVRRQTIPPLPFRPFDKEHLESQKFLDKHRIRSLYFPAPHTQCALSILEVPKLKEFVEAMLLVGAPPGVIAAGATRISMDARITEDGVRTYRHFFWNTDLLDFTETRAVIDMRGSGTGPDGSPEQAYHRAFRRDSRKIAADLPFNPLSALLAQVRMGITPVGVDFASLMERVRVVAGIKCYQYVLDDNRWAAENARNFISVAQAATDLLERSHKPEELLLEKFNTLQLETDHGTIPHIKMLSDGRHTTDLQPTEVAKSVVEVDDES